MYSRRRLTTNAFKTENSAVDTGLQLGQLALLVGFVLLGELGPEGGGGTGHKNGTGVTGHIILLVQVVLLIPEALVILVTWVILVGQ